MSMLQIVQLCSQYINTFGYQPNPDQLISFAKQNGIKAFYKNVKAAIQSIQFTKSIPIKIDSHKKITKSSDNHKLETNETSSNSITNEIPDQNEQPNNDVNEKDPTEVIPHNTSIITEFKSLSYTEESTDSPVTYEKSKNYGSATYQIVVRREYHSDTIININSSTTHYSFDDYTTYLCNNFNMIVNPTVCSIRYLCNNSNQDYNIMKYFSPICHRLITNLTCKPQTKIRYKSVGERIDYVAFGYIRDESSIYNLYAPTEIVFIVMAYINEDDQKFKNPTYYEIEQHPTQIYKYGLYQPRQSIYIYSGRHKPVKPINSIAIKTNTGYHSLLNNINSNGDCKVVCNAYILPLKVGSISGIAACNKMDDDIIDETIKYFRANIFKKTFETYGSADLVLIYLTAFISYCLRKLEDFKSKSEAIDSTFYKCELNVKTKYLIKCPGDCGFPFINNDKFYAFCKPKTLKEKDVFMLYFKQLRGETLNRLIDKCYWANGLQNKHWFQFSKRKFLNIDEL